MFQSEALVSSFMGGWWGWTLSAFWHTWSISQLLKVSEVPATLEESLLQSKGFVSEHVFRPQSETHLGTLKNGPKSNLVQRAPSWSFVTPWFCPHKHHTRSEALTSAWSRVSSACKTTKDLTFFSTPLGDLKAFTACIHLGIYYTHLHPAPQYYCNNSLLV